MLTVDKTYKMTFPTSVTMVAKLHQHVQYPATGMPSDYIWEYVDGDRSLVDSAKASPVIPDNMFPLPQSLFDRGLIKVEEMDDEHSGI